MKNLIIKNINDIKGNERKEREGNHFTVKHVVGGDDVDQAEVAFVEVPVGNEAYGYHYHDATEEFFYIVQGTGILRSAQGEKEVKAGDLLCFPCGKEGAHVLRNSSKSETLIFIDFDVRVSKTDIVTLPDINKIWVMSEYTNLMLDMPKEEK